MYTYITYFPHPIVACSLVDVERSEKDFEIVHGVLLVIKFIKEYVFKKKYIYIAHGKAFPRKDHRLLSFKQFRFSFSCARTCCNCYYSAGIAAA